MSEHDLEGCLGGVPVYPLILHEEGDWTPVPVMYFTREFVLRVIERGFLGFGWSLRAHHDRSLLVYDDPSCDSIDALLPPRKPKGHRVWLLDKTSWTPYRHGDDDVDEVIRGEWPD